MLSGDDGMLSVKRYYLAHHFPRYFNRFHVLLANASQQGFGYNNPPLRRASCADYMVEGE
jgi:hypothetical protein